MKEILKWSKNNLALFLAFAFFEPYILVSNYYDNLKIIDNVYSVLKLLALIYSCGVLFCNIKKKQYRAKSIIKIMLWLLLLQGVIIASTIINKGDLVRGAGHSITITAAFMLGAVIYSNKDLSRKCTYFLRNYLLICLVINMYSVLVVDTISPIASPSIQGGVYFWGISKRFAYLYLPLIFFEAFYEINKYKKIRLEFYILLVILLISIINNATTTIFGILPFLAISMGGPKKIRPYILVVFYGAINYLIAYANGLNFFSKFIENVLHKSMTFSGRTFIWESAQESFYEYPLLGVGYQATDYDTSLFSSHSPSYAVEYTSVTHAHNVLIDSIYRGGLVAGVIYLTFWGKLLNAIRMVQDRLTKTLFFMFVLAVLIMSVFDNFDVAPVFFVYGTIYAVSIHFKRQKEK